MRLVGVVLLLFGLSCAAGCPKPKLVRHRMLRPNRSISAGAHFLTSFHGRDAQSCRKACCGRDLCDTAIHGTKSGHCYLFHCGYPSRCIYSSLKHYNLFIFNRTEKPGKTLTVAPKFEAEEVKKESKKLFNVTTEKPASPNSVHQSARHSSAPSAISTTKPLKSAEVKSKAKANEPEERYQKLVLSVSKMQQQKNAKLKQKVHNLSVAISFISIFLILSFFSIMLILCRAKTVMARMSPKSFLLSSRGDESDDLINGIYS